MLSKNREKNTLSSKCLVRNSITVYEHVTLRKKRYTLSFT